MSIIYSISPSDPLRCPHITPKPGRPGRIIWLSGAPGSGKSTTCQLMARERGYNYYEADAVLQLTNPFVDVRADNPTMAAFAGKPLKVRVLQTVVVL